jgi:hypothetical protein
LDSKLDVISEGCGHPAIGFTRRPSFALLLADFVITPARQISQICKHGAGPEEFTNRFNFI